MADWHVRLLEAWIDRLIVWLDCWAMGGLTDGLMDWRHELWMNR